MVDTTITLDGNTTEVWTRFETINSLTQGSDAFIIELENAAGNLNSTL